MHLIQSMEADMRVSIKISYPFRKFGSLKIKMFKDCDL